MYQKVNFFFHLLGIGYIKKEAKNQVIWLKPEILGDNFLNLNDETLENLNKEDFNSNLNKLKKEDEKLNNMLIILNKRMQNLAQKQNFQNYSYLTFEDIQNISNNKNESNNMIAIKSSNSLNIEYVPSSDIQNAFEKTKDEYNLGLNLKYDEDFVNSLFMNHQLFIQSEKNDEELGVFIICNEVSDKRSDLQELEKNIIDYNNTSVLKNNLMNNKSNNLLDGISPLRNPFNFNQRPISISSISSKFLHNNI